MGFAVVPDDERLAPCATRDRSGDGRHLQRAGLHLALTESGGRGDDIVRRLRVGAAVALDRQRLGAVETVERAARFMSASVIDSRRLTNAVLQLTAKALTG